MVRLVKFLRGYVQIKIWGYSPERFMNLCGNRNILLWDIENHGEYYTMCVSISGFFQLKNCLKKTRTRVTVLKRVGLPFFMPKVRKRKIFGLGFAGCVFFLYFMSRFLWAIEIEGNQAVTDDVFLDFLEQNGVTAGVKTAEISCPLLEEKIRENFDLITWASVQMDGTRLYIQVKENEHPGAGESAAEESAGDIFNQEPGTDLLSQEDGVIVRMVTRSGIPLKKPGDTVEKGEILVQGRVPILNDDGTVRQYQYCDADADIEIKYVYPIEETLSKTYLAKEYTGRMKTKHFIHTLEKEYSLPFTAPFRYCDSVLEEEQVHVFGNLYLPLFSGTVTYREYLPTELMHSRREAEELLEKRLDAMIVSFDEKGVQIIQKNVTILTEEEQYTLKGYFMVISGALTKAPTVREELMQDALTEGMQQ